MYVYVYKSKIAGLLGTYFLNMDFLERCWFQHRKIGVKMRMKMNLEEKELRNRGSWFGGVPSKKWVSKRKTWDATGCPSTVYDQVDGGSS